MVATVATGSIANRLGVNIESHLDDLHKLLKRSTGKRPSSKVLRSIREYFPAWQPTSGDSCVPERYTVDVLEKLVLNVLRRRESPQRISAARPCKEMVSEFIALWTWDEQEWWRNASKRLGSDGCRAFMAGILRGLLHDLYKPRKIDAWVEEVLQAIESYALTGERSREVDKIAKKSLHWKNFRHLESAAVLLLNYRTIDSFIMGDVYGNLATHANWTPSRAFAEASLWFTSMVPVGRKPSVNAGWCSESVIEICESMIRDGSYDRFRDLGKHLALAGCECKAILDHCSNSKQRHMRADWLLTAILKKRKLTPAHKSKTKAR